MVEKRDGAITDLTGVSRGSKELIVWGEGIDVDILKTLPKLETLGVYKAKTKDLAKIARLGELTLPSLNLRFWPEPDLTAFRPPKGLRYFTVWQSNKLVRLDGIEAAAEIEALALNDNGRLESLAPLAALPKLADLSLSGGIWTKQETAGLEGLAALRGLKRLQIRGLDGRDIDLTPVARLHQLDELDLWARDFPMEEVAKVAAGHPAYLNALLDLPDYPRRDEFGRCKKCDATKKQMFLKRRKFLWCPNCDKAGLEKLIATFLEAVEAARQELGLPAAG